MLRHPGTYLLGLAVVAGLAAADVAREPERQFTARVYLSAVRVYQGYGRPVLAGRIRCRYHPSCSRYSAEAVRRWGLVEGLSLTARRIARCTPDVPLDTEDPVPPRDPSGATGNGEPSAASNPRGSKPAEGPHAFREVDDRRFRHDRGHDGVGAGTGQHELARSGHRRI